MEASGQFINADVETSLWPVWSREKKFDFYYCGEVLAVHPKTMQSATQ
ncbi:MAG: hypothetical protein ACI9MC_002591, partial [Kiritimatiellia bacterium]